MHQYDRHLVQALTFLPKHDFKLILDAGSGRTSLGTLVEYFPHADIAAVIYPGDKRKRDSVQTIDADNYTIIEHDLIHDVSKLWGWPPFDLTLAHLLLGEAAKFGHTSEELMHALFQTPTKYMIIMDILEDPSISHVTMTKLAQDYNWRVLYTAHQKREEEQEYENFTAKNYFWWILAMK